MQLYDHRTSRRHRVDRINDDMQAETNFLLQLHNKLAPKNPINKSSKPELLAKIIQLIEPLNGENYLIVKATASPVDNAIALIDAYNFAKTALPNSSPISASNRFTILLMPGLYAFAQDNTLLCDTDFIDIVTISGQPDAVFSVIDGATAYNSPAPININCNAAFIGINSTPFKFDIPGNNLTGLVCNNCIGGDYSFSTTSILSGTFIDCKAGEYSFLASSSLSGTFIRCHAGKTSFGYILSSIAGYFEDCSVAGNGGWAFGANVAEISGTFINCKALGAIAFDGTLLSGKFYNCIVYNGFGSSWSTISGELYNCTQTAFGTGSIPFAGYNPVYQDSGIVTGKIYYCKMNMLGRFADPTNGGAVILCIDGFDDVVIKTAE